LTSQVVPQLGGVQTTVIWQKQPSYTHGCRALTWR